MFRRLRIAVLLYVLLFVAVGQYLTTARTTDWNEPLWVNVYPVNADGGSGTEAYLNGLDADSFNAIEAFFAREAAPFELTAAEPFRLMLADPPAAAPPVPPASRSPFATIWWSLKTRWFVTKLHWSDDLPLPDVTLILVYHSPDTVLVLDRSTALRKGMIAVANVFATAEMSGTNQVVAAHELLHTLGATDKYDLATTLPHFPDGYAEPERSPRYPQTRAEIMGGRIPLSPTESSIPRQLGLVVIGPATAHEIGWPERRPDGTTIIGADASGDLAHGPSAQQDLHADRRRRDDRTR